MTMHKTLLSGLKTFLMASCLTMMAFTPKPAHAAYMITPLVSDLPGAPTLDSNLINPWGLSYSPTGPFWVSDNGMSVSSLYNGAGTILPLVVTIPGGGGGASAPTGQVFAGGLGFESAPGHAALFIFTGEDGGISAWGGGDGTSAVLRADNSGSGAVYKGLAIGTAGGANYIYAADFNNGHVDVLNTSFTAASLPGSFTDPGLPAGYAPFNIQNIGGTLYVTFAKQQGGSTDEQAGAGFGYVDAFDTNGNFLRRIGSGGTLNAPWGLALAPANFGVFSNDLLVGNFGDGTINAFDPLTGIFLGQLMDISNLPLSIDGLWGLAFGNGAQAGATNELYFTAGLNDEADGLFGKISAVPEPAGMALFALGLALAITRRKSLKAK